MGSGYSYHIVMTSTSTEFELEIWPVSIVNGEYCTRLPTAEAKYKSLISNKCPDFGYKLVRYRLTRDWYGKYSESNPVTLYEAPYLKPCQKVEIKENPGPFATDEEWRAANQGLLKALWKEKAERICSLCGSCQKCGDVVMAACECKRQEFMTTMTREKYQNGEEYID